MVESSSAGNPGTPLVYASGHFLSMDHTTRSFIEFASVMSFCLLDNVDAMKCDAPALQIEVKYCMEQVQKLNREFEELKVDIQAALKDIK